MKQLPPRSTRTYTRFPYTTLCRSREGWIPQAREEFFRKVLSLSAREEQNRWTAFFKKDNPDSPQNQFTANDAVFVAIRSVAFISPNVAQVRRSEEHTSELQSLMRISYAVFCLKKKKNLTLTLITQTAESNQ